MNKDFDPHIRSLKFDIKKGNVVIICGAGISHPSPSNLPLASQLIENTLDKFIGIRKKYFENLTLRPEAIFELITRTAKKELGEYLALVLGNGTPNLNHFAIAAILNLGNHVITSNFDCLIEKAAEKLNVNYRRILYWGRFQNQKPYLFKVHGSIDNYNSIALTVDNIHNSFKKSKLQTFKRILNEKRVIVIGYSGADQFDIMPAIKESSYKDITWINHSGKELTQSLPSKETEVLKNLYSFEGDTSTFFTKSGFYSNIDVVRPITKKIKSITVNYRKKNSIALDMLMHLDQYSGVIKMIKDFQLNRYWKFRIAEFESQSILTTNRDEVWDSKKQNFIKAFLRSKYRKTANGLTTLAKWVDSSMQIINAYNEILKIFTTVQKISPALMEAGCELLFELLERRMFKKAKYLFTQLKRVKIYPYSIVQHARFCLESTYYYCIIFENVSKKQNLLNKGLSLCSTALRLYSTDFINDKYFYLQAQNNLGYILILQGNYISSIRYLRKNEKEFSKISKNNQIFTLFLMSKAYIGLGKYKLANKSICKALNINKKNGRHFYTGFLYRQLFYLHKMTYSKLLDIDTSINLLEKSKEEFLLGKEIEQAKYNEELILKLNHVLRCEK